MADTINDVLVAAGFKQDPATVKRLNARAVDPDSDGGDLTANGPYLVQDAWIKGDVVAHLEQNTSPDVADAGPDEPVAVVTHPRVLVITSPRGRVVTSATNMTLLRHVLSQMV